MAMSGMALTLLCGRSADASINPQHTSAVG